MIPVVIQLRNRLKHRLKKAFPHIDAYALDKIEDLGFFGPR